MGKIADVVKLKTDYANFVNLKSAYDEAKENADRMAMYRPTKSHRTAFERLCRGFKPVLVSGDWGTTTQKSYEAIVQERATNDWAGKKVVDLWNLKAQGVVEGPC